MTDRNDNSEKLARAAELTRMGNTLYGQGKSVEAVEAYRESLDLRPQDAATWNNLGAAEQRLDRLAAAQEAYEHCLALAPDHLGAASNLAYLLVHRGQPQRAVELLQRILADQPQAADGWVLLGSAFQLLGDLREAATAFRRALDLDPRHSTARHKLAQALESQGAYGEAEVLVRQLVAEEPQSAEAWARWARILQARGQTTEVLEAMRRSIALAPDPDHHSYLLLSMQYADEATPKQLLEAHRQWDAAYARDLLPTAPPIPSRRDAARPLRLGFVSANFGRHPIAFLVLRALEGLDKKQCSVVCYSDTPIEDDYTARFRAAADVWRRTGSLSADELAEQIRKDEIEVLVDLMGHTGRRLLVFARKPAALQVTWLGYPGTTGMAAMDVLLTDRFRVGQGEDGGYQETVLRMPHDQACFGPPDYAPAVGPLPALTAGRVTFGCFNGPYKYSPRTLDAWAAILCRLPTAQLLLKYGGLGQPAIQDWFRRQLQERGVDGTQILLDGGAVHGELLASYHRVDLALDTLPYTGDLTTCEALWMGVPVVTCPAKTFASRHSLSHLSNTGYERFVAADVKGYVEVAVEWAGRLDELAQVRSELRERVRQSPLCDGPAFARDFLAVLRQAWGSQVARKSGRAKRTRKRG